MVYKLCIHGFWPDIEVTMLATILLGFTSLVVDLLCDGHEVIVNFAGFFLLIFLHHPPSTIARFRILGSRPVIPWYHFMIFNIYDWICHRFWARRHAARSALSTKSAWQIGRTMHPAHKNLTKFRGFCCLRCFEKSARTSSYSSSSSSSSRLRHAKLQSSNF